MFNDGVVKIYTVENIAAVGNKPQKGLTFKCGLRFKERTVGLNRFWSAQQNQVRVDKVLRVPKITTVSTQDIAIPNSGNQFIIRQIQYIEDEPVMDLSLERLGAEYEVN